MPPRGIQGALVFCVRRSRYRCGVSTRPAVPPAFICVDLDLESRNSLGMLLTELEADLVLLRSESRDGKYFASLEFAIGEADPEASLLAFLKLISSLTGEARSIWDESSQRTFNVGLDSGNEGAMHAFQLSNSTLREVVAVGAQVKVTLYPVASPHN